MGEWDDAIKTFISENAQDLIDFVYGRKERRRIRVKRKLQTEFKIVTREADSILEFELEENGKRAMFHMEMQSTADPEMPERLLQYALSAKREHNLPVSSCVIYLRDVGEVPQPPLRWQFLDEKDILWFDYISVELAKVPVEELRATGLMGLLPLSVLTQGGIDRSVLREVVTELGKAKQTNLLAITKLFAGLVFTEADDRKWLERIFAMQNNPLAESWTYQQILNEGIEQGIEKGIEQGIEKGIEQGIEQGVEKGKLQGLQQAVLNVVEARFPPLVELARQRVPRARTPDAVNLVLKGVATAPDENAARFVLDLLAA